VACAQVFPEQTLYHWRWQGIGPKAIKIGRHLRYNPADVARWLDTQRDSA
jgi:predicted DNA-binding transcriptional regulator AlpA